VQQGAATWASRFSIDDEISPEVRLAIFDKAIIKTVVNAIDKTILRLLVRSLLDDNVKDWIRCVLVRIEGAALACGEVERA
jgi:hypothetical protein